MSNFTRNHLQACLDQTVSRLNREGSRTPWPNESFKIVAPAHKWIIEDTGIELSCSDEDLTDGNWFIWLNATIYGEQGGLAISFDEIGILNAAFDPYENLVEFIDTSLRNDLGYIKEIIKNEIDDDDLYGEQYA